MTSRLKAAAIFFIALSLFVLIFSFYGALTYSDGFSKLIYQTFSFICHQERELCIKLYGNPMPVCSRCIGLYTGALLANLIVLTSIKKLADIHLIIRKGGIISIATIINWGWVFADSRLTDLKILSVSHIRRLATGLIAGGSSSVFILFLFAVFFSIRADQRKP